MLAGFHLKVEPKLMSSYEWCNHWIGVHLPSRLRNLTWSRVSELMAWALTTDNWWVHYVAKQCLKWFIKHLYVLWKFGFYKIHMNFLKVHVVNVPENFKVSPCAKFFVWDVDTMETGLYFASITCIV